MFTPKNYFIYNNFSLAIHTGEVNANKEKSKKVILNNSENPVE